MMQEDEGLLDGNELDQYLPPGGQQTHYLYSSSTPTHPLWLVHKSPSDDTSSESPESNNNHSSKHRSLSSSTSLDYHFSSTDDTLPVPPPTLPRYHELQPSSALIKTEREVYQQTSSPSISSSSSSPSMTYHQNLPIMPTPNYFNAGTTSASMSATPHGQYFQTLPRYDLLFGNSADSTWSNYA